MDGPWEWLVLIDDFGYFYFRWPQNFLGTLGHLLATRNPCTHKQTEKCQKLLEILHELHETHLPYYCYCSENVTVTIVLSPVANVLRAAEKPFNS